MIRSTATWATPDIGWRSLLNGQLPKVKPVKRWPKIVQNNTQETIAYFLAWSAGSVALAPNALHFGSPISHQVRIERIRIPTVVAIGVAAPNAGTRSGTGEGDGRSRVAV